MTAAEELIDYLRIVGTRFPQSHEAYYLKHGRAFSSDPLSAKDHDELRAKLEGGRYQFRQGECYMNAARLIWSGLSYCEGFAIGPIPIQHAWVEFKGRPIDVTWRQSKEDKTTADADLILDRIHANIRCASYFGIVVDLDTLARCQMKLRRYAPVVNVLMLDGLARR